MENKLRIINQIIKRHPSLGVDKGWSHYTGGMKDSGDWYFRKLLDASDEELELFLDKIILKENQPPPVYSQQELNDMKIIYPLQNGGFITEFEIKKYREFISNFERRMFGI